MDIKEFFKNDIYAADAGIELTDVGIGYAKTRMPITERHLNAGGNTQGGAIFTLADLTVAVAANSHGTLAVSIHANIHFLKGTVAGDILYAEAFEKYLHKRTGVYQVEVKNQQGDLIALFDATMYRKDIALPFEPLS